MGGMAWAFDIRKRRDPISGIEVPVPWNDFTPLLIAKPAPFAFDLVARSETKVAAMRAMFIEAGGEDDERKTAGGDEVSVGLGTNAGV